MDTIKKTLTILVLSLLAIFTLTLISCSGEKHLELADKHIEKAKQKGAFVKVDTTYSYIYRTDTLYKNGKIVTITNTIIDSVAYQVVNTVTVPKHLDRQERKALKDSLKHVENMYSLETKRLNKLARQNVALTKELRKGTNKQIQQNIKQARIEARGNSIKWYDWIGLGLIIGLCGFIFFKYML